MKNSMDRILVVDDNETNLVICKNILKKDYMVYAAKSADIMFSLLMNLTPDMILLDIDMPHIDGYEAMAMLKAAPEWADIPVIFLTASTDEGSELRGLSLGAVDYLTKPFSAPLLQKRIENHLLTERQKKKLKLYNKHLHQMVKDKIAQVNRLHSTIISTVADLIEQRDDTTGYHIIRTQRYLEILCDEIVEQDLYPEERENWDMSYLLCSARLHDVGKIAISDSILNKPGKLTDNEYEIMKTHVKVGVEAIERIQRDAGEKDIDFLDCAKRLVATHHEKWDGTGYPFGLKGQEIPLEGRLMAIADVYDALTSKRPYKQPFSLEKCSQIITSSGGTHFDPQLIDVFMKREEQFAQVVSSNFS